MSRTHARTVPVTTRRRQVGLVSLVATGALVLGMLAATAVTSSSFTDAARTNLGTEGIGSHDPFGIALVDAAGTAHEAEPDTPLAVDLPDGDALVPGRTVRADVRVANNHPDIAAAVTATVAARTVAGTPDITPYLRFTVLGPDGQVLLGASADSPQDGAAPGASLDLGALAARGAVPVADGAAWSEGAAGSDVSITILIHLLEDPDTTPLNGGRATVTLRFDASSTQAPA